MNWLQCSHQQDRQRLGVKATVPYFLVLTWEAKIWRGELIAEGGINHTMSVCNRKLSSVAIFK